MPELILLSGKRAGRSIKLSSGEFVIGRDEGCRIRLTSSDVSRQHCRLRCENELLVAFDLGSRNGTYVNDVAISKPTPLRPGDLLRVGPFLFQVPGSSDEQMSDEEISGWLTEEGTLTGGPPEGVRNDTTLLPELEERSRRTTAPIPMVAPAPEPKLESNDPIVMQAAEIIRDYWTSKKPH
ncbi:MAG: FHA domain-containing protein [Planctomycetaceae bacterium]|nr:FHA domain-containing protein [Planctomycetaceae bacterium]